VAANIGGLVKGISTLKADISGAAGSYGSTITGYQIRFSNGQATINGASGTTSPLATSGTITITARVTDSRGRYTEKSITVNVLNYAPPTIYTATLVRALASGVVDENGTRAKLNLNAGVATLVVGGVQKNAIVIRISHRLRGATTWTVQTPAQPGGISYSANTLLLPTFGIEQAYEVRVEVIDDFMTSVVQLTLATANIFMHWDAKIGVGIGKFRENGMLDVLGDIYHRDGGVVQPSGMVVAFAGATAPKGWLICNGSSMSRTTYASLFAAIGTTYGNVDDTTFNLPNLKGRIPVGVDSGQTEFDTLGEVGGAKAVALTDAAQNAPHSHGLRRSGNEATGWGLTSSGVGFGDRAIVSGTAGGDTRTGADGGGATHNNLQPYLALHYIIKV
jgi:microcystin-dependent protein